LFVIVAATISGLAIGISIIGFYSSPGVYVNKVRIKLVPDVDEPNIDHPDPLLMQTECEVIRSDLILARMLNINSTNQARPDRRLETQGREERIEQLRQRIDVRPDTNANLLEIYVLGRSRSDAAQLSETFAKTYRAYQENLKHMPPALFGGLKVQTVDSVISVNKAAQLNNLLGLARRTLGALLVGAAAGWIILIFTSRGHSLTRIGVLPSFFSIVSSLVLGVSALKTSVNLPLAGSVALLLGFVVGSLADWFLYARKEHATTSKPVLAAFMTMFFFVLSLEVLDITFSQDWHEWYSSVARFRLRLVNADYPERSAQAFENPKLIQNEHDFICSTRFLEGIVKDFDLTAVWGNRYHEYSRAPYSTKAAVDALARRITVRRIAGTSIIEILVTSDTAEETASLCSGVGEAYCRQRNGLRLDTTQRLTPVQIEALDEFVPARRYMVRSKVVKLIKFFYLALFLAFVAGGATGTVIAWISRRSQPRSS
jgi:capsular polysaccharide biosynthesis protein